MIKIWDVRAVDPNNPLCESAIRNGDGAKPISDLHLQPGAAVDEPGFLSGLRSVSLTEQHCLVFVRCVWNCVVFFFFFVVFGMLRFFCRCFCCLVFAANARQGPDDNPCRISLLIPRIAQLTFRIAVLI
eukprot:1251945-Rhodomonas_salina.1